MNTNPITISISIPIPSLIADLPREINLEILNYCDAFTLVAISETNRAASAFIRAHPWNHITIAPSCLEDLYVSADLYNFQSYDFGEIGDRLEDPDVEFLQSRRGRAIFRFNYITDAAISYLSGCTDVEFTACPRLIYGNLTKLQACQRLELSLLFGNKIDWSFLCALPKCKEVRIKDGWISPKSLRDSFGHCDYVGFDCMGVEDQHMEHLAHCARVDLAVSGVSDSGLSSLTSCEILSLVNVPSITAGGILAMLKCKTILISADRFTPDEISAMEEKGICVKCVHKEVEYDEEWDENTPPSEIDSDEWDAGYDEDWNEDTPSSEIDNGEN